MLLDLDRHNGLPVYRQILEQVRFLVASGVLRPGEELPSTRALAADHGLNPMTVSKAYALLEQEGVVERRPGLSLVVRAPRGDEQDARRREELERVLGPAASAARQLGLDVETALAVFRQVLARRGGDDEKQ